MSVDTVDYKVSTEIAKTDAAKDTTLLNSRALARSAWIPDHLKGKTIDDTIATCYSLVKLSEKWGMSPTMVASETYSVRGKLGFQGKLYAAIANAHGGIRGGLRAIYHGKGEAMVCVVFGATTDLTDQDKENLKKYLKVADPEAATDLELSGVRAVRIVLGSVKTDQLLWTRDPEQKLWYTGCTKWCRRFIPDLVLGVVSVDDLESMQYEPQISTSETQPATRAARIENRLEEMLNEKGELAGY